MTKYDNKKTEVDGILFDSRGEAARYLELCTLERARQISDLELQVTFPLVVNGMRVCKYVADFVYREDGAVVVEDFKGMRTPLYRLKAKLMQAVHGITIRETGTRPTRKRRTRKVVR